MILRGFSGLSKISRDGLDISEDCAGSTDGGAGSAAGAEPAAGAVPAADAVPAGGAGSGDAVGLGVGSSGGVGGVRMPFEPSEKVGEEGGMTSMVSPISSSKSSKMNPPSGIVDSSGLSMTIIISSNGSSSSFDSKKTS